MKNNINKDNVKKSVIPYLLLFVLMLGIMYYMRYAQLKVHTLTYDQFMSELNNGNITEVMVDPRVSASNYVVSGKLKKYKSNESFTAKLPYSEVVMKQITDANKENKFKLESGSDINGNLLLITIVQVGPILVLAVFAVWFLNRQMAGNKGSMDFGKSRAKLSNDTNKVTFKDVAGLKEEKEEVKELIDFLKNPKKFQKMGARIPKGVMLYGPPGTGKTLLAKAVAGEADVPFYFISGSEFVELFVGVGASRVRDMFKEAKRTAPCLIFIDEIDAVGRQRGTGLGGGHDEREQTLNQLLTEMDGFGTNEGIILIAATNRPDVLDPALLRPGRFDRQITVDLPDVREREEILQVHARDKKLAPTITLKNIAKRTSGFSGADLENLLNEAALLSVRRNKEVITMSEIDEAADRVMMGPAKVTRKYSENDRKLVAYHEAGHAVIGLKLEGANVVQKVTIIPRGSAGGYNMMTPREEKICSTKEELLQQITGLLGGRAAEELVFGQVTTGASNDFSKATKIARAMVTEYGMSDLGPLQFEDVSGNVFLGRDYNKPQHFSNEVANEIDMEMRKIINGCHDEATKIIKKNRDLLNLIAETLLEYETLTKEQIDYLVENGVMPEEDDNTNLESMSITKLKELAKKKGIKEYTKMSKSELIKAME
jgi:ATP-dependent metallopeptidase hflB